VKHKKKVKKTFLGQVQSRTTYWYTDADLVISLRNGRKSTISYFFSRLVLVQGHSCDQTFFFKPFSAI